MKLRRDIKLQAKGNFHANYGICLGAFVLFVLISNPISIFYYIRNIALSIGNVGFYDMIKNAGSIGANTNLGSFFVFELFDYIRYPYNIGMQLNQLTLAFSVFLLPPLWVGYSSFNVRIYRGEAASISDMFSTGFSNYWRKVGGILWMQLFIFLWSLLLVIPGIIKSLAYFMTPYILAESENVTATQALKLSMRMTDGYKGEIFVMQLSFIGWYLLSMLTLGLLGMLYVSPYMYGSLAGMYEELKQNAIESGTVAAEELA